MLKKKYLSLSLMFLLVLSLGLFYTSYTMAYTFEDFVEYCQYTKTKNISSGTTNLDTTRNKVADNGTTIKTLANNKGINFDNYNNFLIWYNSASSTYPYTILCYNGEISYSIATNGQINTGSLSWTRFGFNNAISNGTTGTSSNINVKTFGLLDSSLTSGSYENAIIQNIWNYINVRANSFEINEFPYYFADVFQGINNTGQQIKLYYNNEQEIGELSKVTSNVNAGTLTQVSILNYTGLIDGGTYTLKLLDENDNILLTSSTFVINYTIPEPEEPSGDIPSGDTICMCGPILLQILDKLSGDVITAIDNNGNIISGSLSEIGEQIQNNNKALNDIKNVLTGSGDSGDGILGGTELESGEEPTLEDLPSIDIAPEDDPSNEFFTWLLNQIISVLEDDSEQTLVIPIYKTNYEIRSDVFKLEIEPLRTFIQARLVVYCWCSFS